MANVISQLRTTLGVGAKSSKYQINMALPTAVSGAVGSEPINILCNATSFPGVTITPIELYKQGRVVVYPGETEYERTWTCTFYQTENHKLRKDFVAWAKVMDDFQNNKHAGNPQELMIEAVVSQLDHNGDVSASYKFKDLFVNNVGPVTVSDAEANTIQSFDVTFSFTSWEDM